MSLKPARWNFEIWKGTTFTEDFVLLQGGRGSSPQPLSTYSALLEIRSAPEGTILLTLSTGNGRIDLTDNGEITLTIDSTITSGLTWKTGVYDLTITSAGGDTSALLFGNFSVGGV